MEILNNFFTDVGEYLAKKFGESDRCGNSFINRATPICDEILRKNYCTRFLA